MRAFILITTIAVLVVAAAPLRAESVATEARAIGYQVEHADLAAVGSLVREELAGERWRATFALTEVIRGAAAAGEAVTVEMPAISSRPPWREGADHLLFLVRRDEMRPLSGSGSIRALPANGPERRQVEMARRVAAVLDEPVAYRALLLGWLGDPEPGVVWSAATDLARREDLSAELTGPERDRVLKAYLAHPFGKESKEALLLAVAAARPAGAAVRLVDSVLAEGGRSGRAAIGVALSMIGDPSAEAHLARRIGEREGAARADLVLLLGSVGRGASLPLLRGLLSDPHEEVRLQAAHSLGLTARRVREEDPGAVVPGRRDLTGMLGAAKTNNELEAALWCLAQLDDPQAYDVLRGLAERDPREFVRRHAKRYLERPRLSLILD